MATIVSVHSFRGGTGKSNSTANLASLCAQQGYRVAIVDTDIQSPGVHVLFGIDEAQAPRCLNDFLWGTCRIDEAAVDVTPVLQGGAEPVAGRLFVVPSSIKSDEIGRVLRDGYDVGRLNDGFRALIQSLALDLLFIDTHPGVNEETLLSLAISDLLVLIMRPDAQDYQGTAVTLELARRLEVPEILLTVNKVPPSLDAVKLRADVARTFGVEVAGVLPLNLEMVEVASGGVFVTRYPEHPFTRELRAVAGRITVAAAPAARRA